MYHLKVEEAVKKLNGSFSAWVPLNCEIPSLPSSWSRYFRQKDPYRTTLLSLFYRWRDFSRLFLSAASAQRFFFIESFNTSDFAAFTCAALFFAKNQDHLGVLFRYPLSKLPKKGAVHLFFCKALIKKFRSRFHPLSDSESIANMFQNRLNHPVDVFPVLHAATVYPAQKKENTVFWWPGEPRKTKGLETIRHLLQRKDLSSSQSEVWISQEADIPFSKMPVRILPPTLSQLDYYATLSAADFILLPYEAEEYSASTSGIFIEAVGAKKIPLVKEGTWMAHELKKFGLEKLIVDWETPHLFSDALHLKEDREVCAQLTTLHQHYQNFHSVDTFAECLKKAVLR